jgi:CubicO group peptidase (beta-lactamase class C family)
MTAFNDHSLFRRATLPLLSIAAGTVALSIGAATMSVAAKPAVTTTIKASTTASQADKRVAQTESVFADVGGVGQPGCAVAVRFAGRTQTIITKGEANINAGKPITADTVFDIGSVSKQFTAASIQLLVGDGRINLSDPARKYVPELPAFANSVTIEQLIHHTGGLPDFNRGLFAAGNDPADLVTTEEALQWIFSLTKLDFKPGTKYAYSNSGYFGS